MTSIEMFYGWISPQGVFHQVNYGDHTKFAHEEIVDPLEKQQKMLIRGGDVRDYAVEELGWILFDSPTWEAPVAQFNMGKITKDQIEAVLELYHDMMRECPDYRVEAERCLDRFLDSVDY